MVEEEGQGKGEGEGEAGGRGKGFRTVLLFWKLRFFVRLRNGDRAK